MVGVCGLELNPNTNSSTNLAGSWQTWTLLSPLDLNVQPGHPYLSLSIPNRENFEAAKYEKSLGYDKTYYLTYVYHLRQDIESLNQKAHK